MIKILKRISFFIIVLFVVLNTVAFLLMNSPIIQNSAVNYINKNYLQSENLKLSLDSLSLSFFAGAVNLNEVSLTELNHSPEKKRGFHFSLNQLSLALDIPASYYHRRPVVRKLALRGVRLNLNYDENGTLLLPDFLKSKDDDPVDVPKVLKKILPLLPSETNVLNASVVLGKNNEKSFQYLNVNSILIAKKYAHKQFFADVKAISNGTYLRFPFLSSDVKIEQAVVEGTAAEDGRIDVRKLDVNSNVLKLAASAKGKIPQKIENSQYEVFVNSLDVLAQDFFPALGLKSKGGTTTIVGVANSRKNGGLVPTFKGTAQWKNLFLQQFSLYSGRLDFEFKDKALTYTKANIFSPQGGNIKAEGKFNFVGDFNFENRVNIQRFPFAELLGGLGVNSVPVNFSLKAPSVVVSGKIMSPTPHHHFDLQARGKVSGSNFQLTQFNQQGRKSFPDFLIDLNLLANAKELTLDKTLLTLLTPGGAGLVDVPTGKIDFTTPKGVGVDIKMLGSKINLSCLEYFLQMPSAGIADLTGRLVVKAPLFDIDFSAQTTVSSGEIFGLKFNTMTGLVGLDSNGFWAKDTHVNLGLDQSKLANLDVKNLRVNFSDLKAHIVAALHGSFNGLMSSLQHWVPAVVSSANGVIENFSVVLDGGLLNPKSWNLTLNSQINELKILNGGIEKVDILLDCVTGTCHNSNISLQSVYANQAPLAASATVLNMPLPKGLVLIQLDKLSKEDAAFRTVANHIPLQLFDVDNALALEGTLNSHSTFSGTWQNMHGNFQASVLGLKVAGSNIGDLTASIQPNAKKDILIDLHAFNNQLSSQLVVAHNANDLSQFHLDFENFDAMHLLPADVVAKNNLFSQLTGHFSFHGLLNKDMLSTPAKMIAQWKGEGRFESGVIQFQRLILNLNQGDEIKIQKNRVTLPQIVLSDKLLKIKSDGYFDLSKKYMSLTSEINMDFTELSAAFPDLIDSSTEGFLRSRAAVSGPWENLKIAGDMSISSPVLSFRNYPPTFTNVNGKIAFHNKIIEVETLSAKKGRGDVNIAGRVDLSGKSPKLNLRLSTNKAPFRIPIPVFQFVDLRFDSDILLRGNKAPYLLEGDVNVLSLQIFKDLSCDKITSKFIALPKRDQTITSSIPFARFDLNIKAINTIRIQTQCLRGKFSTAPLLTVTGDTNTPSISGAIASESATLQVLKTQFDIKRGQVQFLELQPNDPTLDIQMDGKVNTYNIFAGISGRVSQAHLELSADPAVLPNGDRILESDIISMVSTGQVPAQSSSANLLSASSGVASFLGVDNLLEGTLNRTVTSVTGGLFDNVSVTPNSQNGQVSLRVNASRAVSERLGLGVSYEEGEAGSTRSAYTHYIFNDTISAIGSYNYTNFTQQQTTSEIFSGLKFQFGSQ